jgi:tetratricopeptide (TPR) repeat protein
MTASVALRAAERTQSLAGRRVRYFSRWAPLGAGVGVFVIAALAAVVAGMPFAFPLVLLGAIVPSLGARRAREAIAINNEGVRARGRGDFAEAERTFARAAHHGGTTLLACIALQNLAALALARGAFDDAARLARAALALAPRPRADRRSDHFARPLGTLAIALACSGACDEAERLLEEAGAPNARPRDAMHYVPARALIALRRGRYEDVIALLDANRALLRNSLASDSTALIEAMEGLALGRLGGAYRGTPRRRTQLSYDDRTRAYVDTLVPGGAALLDRSGALPSPSGA